MQETTFEVRIPSDLLAYGLSQDDVQSKVAEWLAISLFADGQVSSGKAARLLGTSRVDFLALLRRYNIPYIDYTSEELAEELETVDQLHLAPGE